MEYIQQLAKETLRLCIYFIDKLEQLRRVRNKWSIYVYKLQSYT